MAPVVRTECSKGHDNWCSGSFSEGPAIRRGVRVWYKLCRLQKGYHDSITTYVYNIVVNSWILCKILLHLWHKIRRFSDYAANNTQLVTKDGISRCVRGCQRYHDEVAGGKASPGVHGKKTSQDRCFLVKPSPPSLIRLELGQLCIFLCLYF